MDKLNWSKKLYQPIDWLIFIMVETVQDWSDRRRHDPWEAEDQGDLWWSGRDLPGNDVSLESTAQWSTVHSTWSTVRGLWSTVHGPWSTVHGPWYMVHGLQLTTHTIFFLDSAVHGSSSTFSNVSRQSLDILFFRQSMALGLNTLY